MDSSWCLHLNWCTLWVFRSDTAQTGWLHHFSGILHLLCLDIRNPRDTQLIEHLQAFHPTSWWNPAILQVVNYSCPPQGSTVSKSLNEKGWWAWLLLWEKRGILRRSSEPKTMYTYTICIAFCYFSIVPISAQKRLRSIFQAPRACTKLSGGPHRLFSIDLAVQSHGDGSWSSPVVGTPQHSLHTKIDQYRLIS